MNQSASTASNGNVALMPMAQRLVVIAACLLVVFTLATTVVGVVNNYSPVPFWDMWDGYLTFYTQVSDGVSAAWWAQHAEHRLLVGNLFFWLDLKYLNGTGIFLFALNVALVITLACMLSLSFKQVAREESDRPIRNIVSLAVLALMCSWIQKENLTWAFQASFFPSLLLPLISFFVLGRALESSRKELFILALVLGALSAGTMANGLAALPIMAAIAVATGADKRKVIALVLTAVAVIAFYFHGYKSPELNGSISESLMQHKWDMFRYLLVYLGGAYSYMFDTGARSAAEIAGGVSLCVLGWVAFKILFRDSGTKGNYVLLGFAAFLLLSGIATAGGRVKFGLDQALSSRYMTYSLAYWSTLTLLLVSAYLPALRKRSAWVALTLAMPLLLVSNQLDALGDTHDRNFNRMLAGLALEMGAKDAAQIGHVFPWMDVGFILAERPRDRNLSIFGNPIVADVHERVGRPFTLGSYRACAGSLDGTEHIPGDTEYVKIRGWIHSPTSRQQPGAVAIVDSGNKMVGYGLVGAKAAGVPAGPASRGSPPIGFVGYMKRTSLGAGLNIHGQFPNCIVTNPPFGRIFTTIAPVSPDK